LLSFGVFREIFHALRETFHALRSLAVRPRRAAARLVSAGIAVLFLVTTVRLAAAEESARTHHEQGRAAVLRGQHEEAIVAYRRAYELKADPSYLYDIAEAYRALGVPERAVFFYRRYLSTHPRPPNRPEVEATIARLDPTPALPVTVSVVPAASNTIPMSAKTVTSRSVSDQERSVIGTWWFWTAVGALAAASATVAIFVAAQEGQGGSDIPATRLGNARIEF
jgi:tetratricopeptide (TPR) repeat protein